MDSKRNQYSLLKKIKTPNDIKNLSFNQLTLLAAEIRAFLIENVSKTGGHLASNLGVVELTISLHKNFNMPKDKIIWDVGHQCYVHKLLTGRMDKFHTLRKLGGLSGFLKMSESEYDVINSGHSSTACSVALGMAEARELSGEKYSVVAVVGDGALTGGLAWEALNNIGNSNRKLIIILNDNEMSISKNVGAFSSYFSKIRANPEYTSAKKGIRNNLERIPLVGQGLAESVKKVKDKIKYLITPGVVFEELGISYLGPIDGHDLKKLEFEINLAKKMDGPVIIHVHTKKGKGYSFAEKFPEQYHGVSTFDCKSGTIPFKGMDYSSVFGEWILGMAQKEKRLVAVCPSMCEGSGLSEFSKKFKTRFFDTGIAEGHAVTFSAGLSVAGLIPIVAVYSSFLQRAFDMVLHDAAINKLHIVICVDRAGLVGEDGETHQGIFDLSYLCAIPNVSVLAPASFCELKEMLDYAVLAHDGVIAIRYPKGGDSLIKTSPFVFGKAQIMCEGDAVTICAEGSMVKTAVEAADLLKEKNISCEVINMRTIKPLDIETVKKSLLKTKFLVTIENNTINGGMGQRLAAQFNVKTLIKAFPDVFVQQGKVAELLELYKMDAKSLAEDIELRYV